MATYKLIVERKFYSSPVKVISPNFFIFSNFTKSLYILAIIEFVVGKLKIIENLKHLFSFLAKLKNYH